MAQHLSPRPPPANILPPGSLSGKPILVPIHFIGLAVAAGMALGVFLSHIH